MPQIANQDYNVIDFDVLPRYEAVERLYRAYLNGTAFDCVVKGLEGVRKVNFYTLRPSGDADALILDEENFYVIKAPLATDNGGYLVLQYDFEVNIVSADGFKLKPTVKDEVLTGVEVTTEKVEYNAPAQYFKDWMIGQPIEGGSNP